ncbi:phosphomethylpyrimidine synthase ThiC [Methanogenium cariaci]|uniref:phosphomethylpyrimidine synthase ThiC n=1 Tax=Methanogenium cariaci TaxID=2197 RepID=UPI00247FD7EC|nr:phosphomethylpyrimidine synthase ThiC [Methanogenium cariaci]
MFVMQTLVRECLSGVPDEIDALARREGLDGRKMARDVVRGRIVVPANPRREHRLCAIGSGCRVKVNVNIGTSGARCDPDLELKKGEAALANGADALWTSPPGRSSRDTQEHSGTGYHRRHGAHIRCRAACRECSGYHRGHPLQHHP